MNPDKIVKPLAVKVVQQGNIYCGYDENLIDQFSIQMFDSQYWQQQDAIIGSAQGRGTTWFIKYSSQQWVLRHYYRGGMMGKINKDKYLFKSLDSTRAVREFTLLQQLQQLNLPAPKPVAYRVVKNGQFYQADLLTEKIADAKDLVTILSEQSLTNELWLSIGQTIKAFHKNGIYHHDLNTHNLLIDKDNKVWLIDFDRGERRAPSESWQQSNMSRLLRSFNKEKKKLALFHWQQNDWQQLMKGYNETN